MKKINLLLSIIALFCQSTFAQTGGLNFQGIARNASGAVLANQKVNLKFSILKTTETGAVEYTETKEATTNAQGIFAVVVGEVNASSFAAIDWKQAPKFLKVEMDPAGGTSFVSMGTTRLQNVPFAYYASGVNANNIDGSISVAKGGTGAVTAADARANLGLVIGTNVQAPLTAGTDYLTPSGSAATLTNFPTLNQSTTGNAATATKLSTARNINGVAFDGSADISITATADASTLSGTVALAKGGTGAATAADARANLGLVIGTNVQAPLTAGTDYLTPSGSAAGLTGFPTLNQNTTGNAATATKLATARNINGVAFDGSTDITIAADVSTLSGTVSVAKGGTGATTAAEARTNLGLVIGTNVQAPLTAGTDYLTPTGSAASLTNFPTLNQNTTGNAASATIAGTITATSNATLTSLSNLNSVGTITSGVWSGTVVSVAKGGTGTSTLSGIVVGGGSNALSGLSGTVNGETLNYDLTSNRWKLTGKVNLSLGIGAGQNNQGTNSIALGSYAGNNFQNNYSIALGEFAGQNNQGAKSIALGSYAGNDNQDDYSIALGEFAGQNNQGANSIALGQSAGITNQGSFSIALGSSAGNTNQQNNSIALGRSAGGYNQGSISIALGSYAGGYNQGSNSIAVGIFAGNEDQGNYSIGLGTEAGYYTQGQYSIALGTETGRNNQGESSIALGRNAGQNNQGNNSIAIGRNAGVNTQGQNSIALGQDAGSTAQGQNSIALGQDAGSTAQGTNSIAIGRYAGRTNQPANSIILNSSGLELNAPSSGFYVKPINYTSYPGFNLLAYDRFTGEIMEDFGKTFVINHPTKTDNYLVHAAIEGPEVGVYYRGEAKIENNKSVIVSLPDYVSDFANNFTIQITQIYEGDEDNDLVLRTSRVKNNSFTVYGKNTSFYWVVYGQRGSVEVEPKKSEVELRGDGPYKYLLKKK
jgi:hypothetical protein